MIKSILRDVRAVRGVTGVALLRKRDGYTENIFPAAFTEEHAAALYKILVSVYRQLRGFSRLMLSFERVTLFLYNRPEFLLLVTTQIDLDQQMFELVVNSKFTALHRALDSIPVTGKPLAHTATRAASSLSSTELILDAMNRLSDKLIAECGRAQVTRDWREARKTVGITHPLLSLFSVDGNGHWAIRRGQQPEAGIRTTEALAGLILVFIDKLGPLQRQAKEIFATVIERDRELLEKFGFFNFLKIAKHKETPT